MALSDPCDRVRRNGRTERNKTRTWFSVKYHPVAAWAGLWRESVEWGAVYSSDMTAANEAFQPVHDRMPVLLMPDEQDRWLHEEFEDLLDLQERKFPPKLVAIRRTDELWAQRKSAVGAAGSAGHSQRVR